MSGLLVPILVVEISLLVLSVTGTAVHATWRSASARRLRPRMDGAHTAVAAAASPGGADAHEAARAALARLPRKEQLFVLARTGERVSGEACERVTRLVEGPLERRLERWGRARGRRPRLRAARVLTATGGGSAVMPRLIEDGDPLVRAQAAMWVVRHGDDDAVAALVRHTLHDEGLTRFASADAVVRLGSRATPALAAAIRDGSGLSLVVPLRVAGHVGDLGLLDAVLAHRHAPEPAVRAQALRSAARIGGIAQAEFLLDALDDPDAEVRVAAVEGLGRIGAWRTAPQIGRALRDQAWDVRRAAGLALLALDAPGQLVLRRALDDDDRFAREMARRALDEERVG